jgi:hypothetical protein
LYIALILFCLVKLSVFAASWQKGFDRIFGYLFSQSRLTGGLRNTFYLSELIRFSDKKLSKESGVKPNPLLLDEAYL